MLRFYKHSPIPMLVLFISLVILTSLNFYGLGCNYDSTGSSSLMISFRFMNQSSSTIMGNFYIYTSNPSINCYDFIISSMVNIPASTTTMYSNYNFSNGRNFNDLNAYATMGLKIVVGSLSFGNMSPCNTTVTGPLTISSGGFMDGGTYTITIDNTQSSATITTP